MKKLIVFGAFLMLGSVSNKVLAQATTTDVEATVISVNSNKITGIAYSATGDVIEFVNQTLVDVLPGDKVLIITTTSANERRKVGRITFKAKEGATM